MDKNFDPKLIAPSPVATDPAERRAKNEAELREKATTAVVVETIASLRNSFPSPPKYVSGQTSAYRRDLVRNRILAVKLCCGSALAGMCFSLFSQFRLAAAGGGMAVASSIWLGICILREVLNSAGLDIQKQFMGPDGPFRRYEFVPSITETNVMFSLLIAVCSGLVLGFAEIYLNLTLASCIKFSHPLDTPAAIYFSVITFATVGYGDLNPSDRTSRILVTTQVVSSLFVITVVLSMAISWILARKQELAQTRAREREAETDRRESLLKASKLGLYADDEETKRKVDEKMVELREHDVTSQI